MAFTVQDLIQDRAKPTTIPPDALVQEALDIMIEHDFSQLPVVDAQDKLLGVITGDSILRTLSNFHLTIDKLKVRQAMSHRVHRFRLEDDMFDLLDELMEEYSVLIVDHEGKLVGIVTNYDTTAYFRRRAENMMLVEDIETALKDHIHAAYRNTNSETDEAALAEAIKRVTNSLQGKFRGALQKYLQLQNNDALDIDPQHAQQAFAVLEPPQPPKPFDRLSFDEYKSVLLHGGRWDSYRNVFDGIDRNALKKLLEDVRDTRNDLAHFRSEITPKQHAQLQFCADWFAQHQAPVIYIGSGNAQAAAATGQGTGTYTAPSQQELATSVIVHTDDEFVPLSHENEEPTVPADEESTNQSKYAPLALMLQHQPRKIREIELSFSGIEEIIGAHLPDYARQHRSWWANDSVGHVQSQQWLEAGWRVASVNMTEERVTFSRMIERERAYISFFATLIAELRAKAQFALYDFSPNGTSWHTVFAFRDNGRNVAWLNYSFAKGGRFRAELYIDAGDQAFNKAIFDALHKHREEVDATLREPVNWERIDEARASRVAIYHSGSIQDNAQTLAALRSWATGVMIRLHKALAGRFEEEVNNAHLMLDQVSIQSETSA